MTPREIFEKRGELYPCSNPAHDFQFGRVMVRWAWAESSWSDLSDRGTLATNFLSIGVVETTDGLKAYKFCCWKLLVFVGFV